jgi:hypothetical protein
VAAQNSSSGCLKFFVVGCLVFVVLTIVAAGGIFYVVKNKGAEMIAFGVSKATEKVVEESGLPEEDKEGVRQQMARVTERIAARELGFDRLEVLSESFETGPLPGLFFLQGLQQGPVERSGLSPEEKEDSRRTIERLQHRLVEGTVSAKEIFKEVRRMADGDVENAFESDLSDDEVRSLVESIRTMANEAEIPDGTFRVDVVGEVRKVVDLLLAEGAAGEVEPATP